MARLVEQIIKHAPTPPHLDPIYETDMAEGLKAMALEGHGLAFLPASSVRKELKARRLVAAGPSDYELTMEVRMYRERPEVARHTKPGAQELWAFLQSRQ
jgi:DNA-binding transcriptional LysR family regulator